ncbi:heme/hemin ABC transporter substrate-binding protein [Albibacterium bauzanense]|uniref:Iron complex transport system substrate-binding protein n=1 Tax=Albibacterium bauzanense TaxID=653929 RepID=A0A4R1M4P9_9SPHI|nr:ABC transporter substrate-binding protein [Albibacterium bauzanense]TCK85864.1 iron complex transport system substrate-binding protein [Albibacterium bauzanense]
MNKNTFLGGIILLLISAVSACNVDTQSEATFVDSTKIVSINGTVSEILVDLGFEDNIVGVDVASTYPASLNSKPKVGHSQQMAAEGIIALGPDVVIGTSKDVKPELADQIRNAGVKLLLFDQEYSPEGTKKLIKSIADSLNRTAKGDSIISIVEADLAKANAAEKTDPKPKVLFIYARGTGTMMVAGNGTQVEKIIELAGGQNAVSGFTDYKPLTAEALVAANPDVILLFDSGLSSLGDIDGLLEVQGVKETNAGKNRKIVEMDGQFLTGFSQRLGKAVLELAEKIH